MVALPEASTPTLSAIYEAYESEHRGDFRDHLGASLIGKPCERALWYDFRWVTLLQFPGRILRLFETGQMEEARLVRNLRATGATVLEVDPETGRQWRIEAYGGHFGGSLDAVAVGLREAPTTWHVVEFKTHSAKSFRDLAGKGVAVSKPRHWAQMQIYMHLTDLSRALYVAVCKDTDALYVERVRADRGVAIGLLDKARRVIEAKRPPSRISQDQNSYECRFCEHRPVCHEGAAAELNCRTCLHSTPVEGGWHCARFDHGIDGGAQRTGCSKHLFIPGLVPGEVMDAGDDHVVYRMANGEHWVTDARDSVP